MRTTTYCAEIVLSKRPYLDLELCAEVIADPLYWEAQPDGRMRFWGEVTLPGETQPRYLRVVTLADGATLHNAFLDRRCKP